MSKGPCDGRNACAEITRGSAVLDSRRLRQLLAVFFAFSLIASACGGGDGDGGSTASDSSDDDSANGETTDDANDGGVDESADGSDAVTADDDAVEVIEGGTIRMTLQTEADSLNPTNTGLNRAPILLNTAVMDTLVVVDKDGKWHNNLTESWTPNADFTSWDVTMREGVTFSDGGVMDADAVIRTVEAFLGDPLTSLVFRPAFNLDNPIEKVDDMTFRLNAKRPNAYLPYYFAEQLGMVGSPAWLDARDVNPELDQLPIGAGPYMISERIQDQKTVLVRNPNYFGEPGKIDTFEFYPVSQESTRTDQFLSGDVELTHGTDAESILRLRDEGDAIQRIEDNSGEEFLLLMNAQVPPFDDIRVREAATAATPKQQYLDFINEGTALEADSLFSTDTPWNVPGLTQADDMPEVAGPLIEAYCADVPDQCTDGKVDIEYQTDGPSAALERIATVFRDAWSPFFNIELQVIPNDTHIQEVIFGQYNVATWRYHGFSDPDVDTAFLSCETILALSINWSRNCNPERDALIAEQGATTDFDERYDIWVKIQENLRDSFQYITLTHTNWIVGASSSVGGLCDAVAPDGAELPCQDKGVVRLSQLFLTS